MKRWLVIILLTFSTACAPEYSGKTPPPIIDGTIDLSGWDFEKDGPISLDGEWLFAWKKFVEPAPWDSLSSHLTAKSKVPSQWLDTPDPKDRAQTLPGDGFATYALRLHLGATPELALRWTSQVSATQLHLVSTDGRLLARGRSGRPSSLEEEEVGVGYREELLSFGVEDNLGAELGVEGPGESTVIILLHLSSWTYERGGPWYSFQLQNSQEAQTQLIRAVMLSALMLGILVIVSLSHMVLYLIRRQDRAALHFALFCAAMCIRLFVMGPAQQANIFRGQSAYVWLMKFEYIAPILMILTLALFVHSLIPARWFWKWVVLGVGLGCGSVLILIVLLTGIETFTSYRELLQSQVLIGCILILGHLFSHWRTGNRWARLLLGAFGVLTVGAVNDILLTNLVIESIFIAPYATLLYILAQSAIVAARNAEAHSRAELLGQNLQEEVRLQTIELQEQTDAAMRAKEEANSLRQSAEEDAEKLRELDQQKTAFFQNMSHELRTPLTLILGPLEDETKAQPTNDNLNVSTKNARRLLRLVNQLLDFQKLEAGKKDLSLAPLNLNRFTHVLGDYFASACSSKAIAFNVTRDGRELVRDEVVAIQSEIDALEKVAFNFLSNALKYTPRGGTIELGLQSQPENRVRLFVKDSGPGISEEGQTKLFQVFRQVEESTTREYEGTGLGLALVKSLVEEMGGTVGVESEVGQGSTFFAEFPVIEADAAEQEEFQARAWLLADGGETGVETEVEEEGDVGLESEGKGQLVLVVDDLEDMRNLIGNALKKRGYRVLKAANGEQGYEVICDRRPDLVISDWMMPKLSGPDMLRQVRANTDVATTPFILLTAKSDEESKLIGTEIGADVFLGKPFNDQELGSAVRNLLGLKSREKEVQKLNDYITESVLKRYLPPALIGDILSGELSMDKPAELRDITVLFSDLKGFTKTSEDLGPEGISAFLNEYLTVMNEVIFEHGGTIDKFIGDAIMVLFGAPQDMSPQEQVKRATDCAKAMQRAMEGITRMWKADGAGDLQMRIGIHHGSAVVGNFGSTQRSDYTAIGPCVNMAARIESASEPGEVFISEATAKLMGEEATAEVGAFELKGIEGKATLYRVV